MDEAELHLEHERVLWDRLMHEGAIDTSELVLEDEQLRGPILDLIAQARLDPDGIAITRDGRQIHIELLAKRSTAPRGADRSVRGLHCGGNGTGDAAVLDHDDDLSSMGRIVAPDGTFFLPSVRLIAMQPSGEQELESATSVERSPVVGSRETATAGNIPL
jgi:hypothetical protein